MGNYSAGMEGMPNIFNFIPESKSSGMNDLPGLLALTRDGNNNNDNGWGRTMGSLVNLHLSFL